MSDISLDCGDSGCYFAKTRGGMRTNGGCYCFSSAGFSKSLTSAARELLPEVLKLRDENAKLRKGVRLYRQLGIAEDIPEAYAVQAASEEWERVNGHLVKNGDE